jgi:lysophospholipase L1-like esterase
VRTPLENGWQVVRSDRAAPIDPEDCAVKLHRHLTLCLGLILVLGAAEARAGAGHFTYATGSGTPQTWAAYGDSIIAGYCGIFCSIKSYASYYADSAAAENGWNIDLEGFPHSGETTSQIYSEMAGDHNAQLRAADLVIWSAGGNDFLDARSDYASSCNLAALDQALDDWMNDWDQVISLVAAQADPGARIRTMDIYYPNPDQDRNNFCGQVSDFDAFYPRLIAAGDYICNTAAAAGFLCADSLSAMNCDEIDANHTIDPNCFDPSGNNFRDPLTVIKYVNGVPTSWPSANNSGMIQSDRTHPGAVGQQYIAAAHHDLGYSDVTTGVCGDFVCDPGETPASCSSDCPDVCGDGLCTGSEDAASCSVDCPDLCGDGLCTGSEDTTSCVADCGSLCGDGVCNGSEDEFNCAADCAVACFADGDGAPCTSSTVCCSGVGNCTGGKPANRVCAPTASLCGDGVVEGSEDCEAGVPLGDTCLSLGFDSGSLACFTSTCEYDASGCVGGSCAGNKQACTVNSDCCSLNCKNGSCKGN